MKPKSKAKKPQAGKTSQARPDTAAIFAATFDRIAERGLGKTRLSDLAQDLKINLIDLYRQYPSVEAIINALMDEVDRAMLDTAPASSTSDKRDIYFDLIMMRLDTLQPYKAGIVRWLKDTARQPTLWRCTLSRWERSLSLMLDIAKDSPLFPVKKLGLAVIYAATLRAWARDDSADLSKTMAVLDQSLSKAENFGQRFMTRKKAA